jgi:CheY-like chemotaxis protein
LAADATSLRVISIDYTVASLLKWNQTTDQVISVIQALKDHQGYSLDDIAIYGDSACCGLAIESVLKMRDDGMGMPTAVILRSPWTMSPKMVILDLKMPKMNGVELSQELQNIDPNLFYRFITAANKEYIENIKSNNPDIEKIIIYKPLWLN